MLRASNELNFYKLELIKEIDDFGKITKKVICHIKVVFLIKKLY